MDHYTSKIQLDKDVINDVFTCFTENTKMLVFGLGYDSKMWYEGNNKNTFFIEDKEEFIQLNLKDIPSGNIVKYKYNTTCATSVNLSDAEISKHIIPEKIMNEAPFDIIIIDGPTGFALSTPGRLIPCYWSTILSKPGTIIYIDDANRKLESYCINKYFKDCPKKEFVKRERCVKIFI